MRKYEQTKNTEELIGKKFNRLTVIDFHHKERAYHKNGELNGYTYFYLCQCDCGNYVVTREAGLKNGHAKSCGCFNYEKFMERTTKHNQSKTRLFKILTGMKQRCYNPNNPTYKHYGGRGIQVCIEWHNFENFQKWAMDNGYAENLTIERIDVNGNYCPENCKWIPLSEQNSNKRTSHFITFNNETKCLKKWADTFHIHVSTLSNQIRKMGEEQALNLYTQK